MTTTAVLPECDWCGHPADAVDPPPGTRMCQCCCDENSHASEQARHAAARHAEGGAA